MGISFKNIQLLYQSFWEITYMLNQPIVLQIFQKMFCVGEQEPDDIYSMKYIVEVL